MIEFKIEKDVIKKIIDKFSIKYQIEKSLIDAIYANTGISGEVDMNAYNPEEDKDKFDFFNINDNKKEEDKKEEDKKEEDKKEENTKDDDTKEDDKNEENKKEDNK